VIYLLHHADAVGPEVDPQRPLSGVGKMHAERLAAQAAKRGVKPAAIWHSGKLRARQTAEPFWRACNPLADFSAIRGLQPDDPPEWIRDLVVREDREVMLVGHMPSLPAIYHLILSSSGESALVFPMHGLVALEREGPHWSERWRLDR
jgi:phosphohistidine phosphatase